jgi:hypothetical protein
MGRVMGLLERFRKAKPVKVNWTQPPVVSSTIKLEAVTAQSPPDRIVENFINSGYFLGLTDDQEKQARADPVGWLQGHPYLFAWYPQFFVDASGKIKPTQATVDAMKKRSL